MEDHKMKRREFIKDTAIVSGGIALSSAISKSQIIKTKPNNELNALAEDNIMIILELFGGNDGLNTIIPVYNDTYYNLRPTLAYPEDRVRRFQTSDVYMNPSLVDGVHNGGMMSLLENGRLAIIEGIGYVDPNLSHFRSQDIWLSGINNSDNSFKLLEGWLGRYFARKLPNYPMEIPEDPLAIQIGGTLSLTFKSEKGDMGIALSDPDRFYELGNGLSPAEPLMPGDTVFGKEFNFAHVMAQQCELYSTKIKEAYDAGKSKLKVSYSDGLAKSFETISALIAGGLNTKVYYVKLSNFDSHAQQMTSGFGGQHPTLLREVANSISEFMDDAVLQGWSERVVGMTISEFGRRAYDNGSRGTDHGAASMQFVFGDYVNAGYFGEKPDLDDLDEDGNIRHQFDYRRTYADFLETWLGADPADTAAVFGEPFMPIGVLKRRESSVSDPIKKSNGNGLLIYPNPSPNGKANLVFELIAQGNIEISIHNMLGFKVKSIFSGLLNPGIHNFNIDIAQQGTFVCTATVNGRRYSSKFVVLK
jgi:uncharacterized protein (DUF1501 family)